MPDQRTTPDNPGKREQTKQNNRTAIIDAARQVFAEIGYGETRVRDIIRRTGLASGTFYNYFPGKEEVFQALRDETAAKVRPRLRAERIRTSSFEAFMLGTFRSFFSVIATHRDIYAVIRRNSGMLRAEADNLEIIAGFDELRVDVEDAVRRGLIPRLDMDYLVGAIAGVAVEVGDRMIERDPIDIEGAAQFAAALFMGGIKALPVAGDTNE